MAKKSKQAPISRTFVPYFSDRDGQPLGSGSRAVQHADRQCPAIARIPDVDIRHTTDDEAATLPKCQRCA
jgi:hypothetical protein